MNSAMTLQDWGIVIGIIVGIVTATISIIQWWVTRKDKRLQLVLKLELMHDYESDEADPRQLRWTIANDSIDRTIRIKSVGIGLGKLRFIQIPHIRRKDKRRIMPFDLA